MYDNIGSKIKGLAKITFFLGTSIAVITGFALIASDEDLITIGLLVMTIAPFVAWVSSCLLYGFGELIDKTFEIERNTRDSERKSESLVKIDSDRINKLERLRSQGLITEEEYQQAISKTQ